MKKLILLSVLIIATSIVQGCYQVQITFEGQKDGTVNISPAVYGDEIMAGSELIAATQMIVIAFPDILENYDAKWSVEGSGFNRQRVARFKPRRSTRVPSERWPYATYKKNADGTYSFHFGAKINLDLTHDTEPDKVIFSVRLIMPGKITAANSMQVSGKEAYWLLTKRQVASGFMLQATSGE